MTARRALLQAHDLGRRFNYRKIFHHVSFSLHPGEGLLVLGANGTGKTTLLRVLAGLLSPTHGTVKRDGAFDLVAHETMTYDALTARENLEFYARLGGNRAAAAVPDVLDRVGLSDSADHLAGRFSRGMRQRLSIARAMLSTPDVLLLDEPFSSLDHGGVQVVSALIREWREAQRAVVVVSHDLPPAVPVCTHRLILAASGPIGPTKLEADPAEVAAAYARESAHD